MKRTYKFKCYFCGEPNTGKYVDVFSMQTPGHLKTVWQGDCCREHHTLSGDMQQIANRMFPDLKGKEEQ